jgi:hypothetical protein
MVFRRAGIISPAPASYHGNGKLNRRRAPRQRPHPEPKKTVVSIDLVSTLTDAAPFLVAMTVEKE